MNREVALRMLLAVTRRRTSSPLVCTLPRQTAPAAWHPNRPACDDEPTHCPTPLRGRRLPAYTEPSATERRESSASLSRPDRPDPTPTPLLHHAHAPCAHIPHSC